MWLTKPKIFTTCFQKINELKLFAGDFPGHPVVKTLCFHCRGSDSILGWGTKIPHAFLTILESNR